MLGVAGVTAIADKVAAVTVSVVLPLTASLVADTSCYRRQQSSPRRSSRLRYSPSRPRCPRMPR